MEERAKKKILIIDDEEDFCHFVKTLLNATGSFEVSACCDSKEAIRLVKEQQPDLILLDIMMPGVSGPEIVEDLRVDTDIRKIPFIFLTALVTVEDLERKGNVIGGNYTVAKPVKMNELINVINEVLGTKSVMK